MTGHEAGHRSAATGASSTERAPGRDEAIAVLSWNLGHGLDFGDEAGRRRPLRHRISRSPQPQGRYLLVNRDLGDEFAEALARWEWDIALLQECPPRWHERLRAIAADGSFALTSRNSLPALRSALARCRPHLMRSNEGGSNGILVRGDAVRWREQLTLTAGSRAERRTMVAIGLRSGLCVACLHASNDSARAPAEVLHAADEAMRLAGDRPLIFGGDFNVAAAHPGLFAELTERGLEGRPGRYLDHILGRGLQTATPIKSLPDGEREVPEARRRIRLSDHVPVRARFHRLPSGHRSTTGVFIGGQDAAAS